MGLVVNHNLNAINANNKLNTNVIGVKKATEKLSSGLRINRAGDDASGLAISEKMRSQVRGLGQAIKNANDGISLIQTAEGGLNETHAILQRMRELAVQASNDTLTDSDRAKVQLEVDALKSEIDRISTSTEFNTRKLLDGSLAGGTSMAGEYGARFGLRVDAAGTEAGGVASLAGTVVTSSIDGVQIEFKTGASGIGGENAEWSTDGKDLTINLANGVTYTQAQIDDLIKNAKWEGNSDQLAALPEVSVKLGTGIFVGTNATFNRTEAGVRAASGDVDLKDFLAGQSTTEGYANTIRFTSNNYGPDSRVIRISTDVARGEEKVVTNIAETDPNVKNGEFTLHLATGTEYTKQDIENIMRRAGLDYEVSLNADGLEPNGFATFYASRSIEQGAEVTLGVTGRVRPNIELSDEGQAAMDALNAFDEALAAANEAYDQSIIDKQQAIDDAEQAIIDILETAVTAYKSEITTARDALESEILDQLDDDTLDALAAASIDITPFTAAGLAALTDAELLELANKIDGIGSIDLGATGGELEDFDNALSGADDLVKALNLQSLDEATPEFFENLEYSSLSVSRLATLEDPSGTALFSSDFDDLQALRDELTDLERPANRASQIATDVSTEFDALNSALGVTTGLNIGFDTVGTQITMAGYDYATTEAEINASAGTVTNADEVTDGVGRDGQGVGKDAIGSGGRGLTFQIGANGVADQRISLSVENMGASALGVSNLDVTTDAGRNDAIQKVDDAIEKVSVQRAALGALQNRLEHTVNNLTTTQENLTAAESQIRDTDMATEMISYTKYSILQQAAQAMLAQANQAPQAILQLLG